MARNAFAEFLVARRGELRPADVGLPEGGRRRTPGLRREEVAVLAGVSADYLARLEQGRDTNPSLAVVDALADALRLDGTQRQHFGLLALISGNESRCPGAESPHEQISDTVRAVLDALDPTPAFVVGRRWNILGWNHTWAEFAAPLGLIDRAEEANLAGYVFTDPRARHILRDWPAAADSFATALLRAKLRWPGDSKLLAMIDALRREPEFDRRWQPQRVGAGPMSSLLRFDHPTHGTIDVPVETMETDSDQSVVVWLVDRAATHSPGLRLVHNRAANE
ncbi:helix-turn-helix domain-containing protein [Nocardia puris]|uniref:helix-turn-helix transcriptional regulator n=1 Tax=Nocardia puris TaxID=208602 RepID=UPI001895BD8D|nr:helix-turn-helix transcriptional regulator [Nocardia puris]MBF6211054.1 helix-turn-helix domain-containing protein [Nocardia puris]MBF6364650.1 helix-turn-helix domain-containing protein [Nocardia puris]MBF6459579.1 helix-turn-helix domain-containing protein [Nocardia puris]